MDTYNEAIHFLVEKTAKNDSIEEKRLNLTEFTIDMKKINIKNFEN